MSEETAEGSQDNQDASEPPAQADLSPWETPRRSTDSQNNSSERDNTAGNTGEGKKTGNHEIDKDDLNSENEDNPGRDAPTSTDQGPSGTNGLHDLNGVDWERRELGDSYPDGAKYHCNTCNEFHCNSLSELRDHVEEDEDLTWGEYLKETGLHSCAGCSEPLSTLEDLYCENCTQNPTDRIPCRNCGIIRVKTSDPFCSASCAGERIEATDGAPAPLDPPNNPSDSWLDHPHRLETGIPSGAPFVENHWLECRECYEYGADTLHKIAVHVSEKHEFGWGGYINKYALRRCRVCEDPLESLLPLYCGDECQQSDPDPARECKRLECDAAVERRQKYCSRDCYNDSSP